MSRRYPGAEARSAVDRGTAAARHRWAASLGTARQDPLLDDGPAAATDGAGADGAGADGAAALGLPATRFRWRTGRRAAALLAVMSVLLGGWFWWQAADGAPRVQPLGEPAGTGPTEGAGRPGAGAEEKRPGGQDAAAEPPGAASGASSGAGGTIVVHVAGAVASPGVVELPAGSRLHEAIKAAGGSTGTADLDRLNLAVILEDGQKILVPERGSADAASPDAGADGLGSPGGAGPPASKVNLNTAGVEELATLPRVGPVLALRIVDWRKQHGRFRTVQELDAVEGVGPKLLEALLPLVRV